MDEHTNDVKRLESWKAIANYLNRSVRTVRRWESAEGLPVHRHRHSKGASIYAYCHELDAWREQHEQQFEPIENPDTIAPAAVPIDNPETIVPAPAAPSRAWLRYATFAVLVLTVGGTLSYLTWNSTTPGDVAAGSAPPGWVLISMADNRTGLEVFDHSFTAAVRREIGNSTPHRHLPNERLLHALRMMRKAPQTLLTPQLAHEVGVREPGVIALLVPRAEKLGDGYLLSVDIADPANGVSKASASAQVTDLKDVLRVFNDVARQASESLRQLPAATEQTQQTRLPVVTTSSLAALRLYAQAQAALHKDQPEAASALLQLAIENDPEFVSAKALQAWTLRRSGRPLATYLPVAQSAAVKLGEVSPAEHYFVAGTYQHFSGDTELAESSYRALLRLSPTDVFGVQAMLELCLETESAIDCVPCRVRLAELLPDHFESNLQAAWALAAEAGQPKQAAHYVQRTRQLLNENDEQFSPESVARARLLPVMTAWADGDLTGAIQESQRLREALPAWPRNVQDRVAEYLGEVSLALGRIQEAETLFDLVGDPARRHELRAATLFARGDTDALRKHLAAGSRFQDPFTVQLMLMADLRSEALALHDALQSQHMSAAQAEVVRGNLALMQGRREQAMAELQQAMSTLAPTDRGFYFVGPDLLAAMLRADGNLNEAVNVLEMTTGRRRQAAYYGAGVFWVMCQHQLAQLYHEIGRHKDANQLEERLRAALRFADQNHPITNSL